MSDIENHKGEGIAQDRREETLSESQESFFTAKGAGIGGDSRSGSRDLSISNGEKPIQDNDLETHFESAKGSLQDINSKHENGDPISENKNKENQEIKQNVEKGNDVHDSQFAHLNNPEIPTPIVQNQTIEDQKSPTASPTNQKETPRKRESEQQIQPEMKQMSPKTKQTKSDLDFEALNIEPPAVPYDDDDFYERLDTGSKLKESATQLLKEGKYKDALKIYESAWISLKPKASDIQNLGYQDMLSLECALYNNMSFCYTKLEDFKNATIYAHRVLLMDANNVKALFRYANGLTQLGDNVQAYETIQRCVEIQKNSKKPEIDQDTLKLYYKLKDLCKEHIALEKQKSRELFSKMLGDSSPQKNEKKQTSQKDENLSKSGELALSSIPSVLTGLVINSILEDQGVGALQRSVASISASAGVFTGIVKSEKSWLKVLFGALPAVAYIGYQIFKKR